MYIGLTVTGPTDEVTRFREAVRGRNETDEEIIIDFNRVIPIPQEITDPFTPQIQTDEHHVNYSTSWVERNWGASSNALYTEILDDKGRIVLGAIRYSVGLSLSHHRENGLLVCKSRLRGICVRQR